MKRLHLAALALAMFAALAITACGNDEENEYVDEVNGVQTAFLDEITAAASTPATNPSQVSDLVGAMQGAFDTAAADLGAVEPPEEVVDLHDELIATMSELGDQVGTVGEALQSGNAQEAQQAAIELQAALTESQTQVTELTDEINNQLLD